MRRRHGAGLFGAILAAVAGVILVALYHHAPSPAAWPSCRYFRCLGCGGPASVDPHQHERWGCRNCGFTTYHLAARFRTARRSDIPDDQAWIEALAGAGVIVPEGACSTLIRVYQDSGGRGYRVTPDNACRGK